jgi:SNF2 family DNA or RNA helicase
MAAKQKSVTKKRACVQANRIRVDYPYSSEFVNDCRKVPGREWNAKGRYNSFPLDAVRVIREMADSWNFELEDSVLALPDVESSGVSLRSYDVEIENDNINIRFPYNPALVAQLRAIVPGCQWVASQKVWKTNKSNLSMVLKFATDANLTLEPTLAKHNGKILEDLKAMQIASSAINVVGDVNGLSAQILSQLMPYQKAGISYLKKARRAILGDQPGLGKSLQALATVASEQEFPVVIVCPNTLKLNWQSEVHKFFPLLTSTVVSGTSNSKIPESDVVIINYDIAYERLNDLEQHGFRSLIVDESHAIKNGKISYCCPSCGTKVFWNTSFCVGCEISIRPKRKWSVKRTGAVMELAEYIHGGFILLLTGTPITNRPEELINQLEAIRAIDSFGGRWRFKQRYSPGKNVATNTQELNEKLRSFCFVRRLKQDVYNELPSLRNAVQLLSIADKDRAQYDEIENNVVEYLAQRAREIAEEEGSDGTEAYWSKRMKAEAAEHLVRISVLRDSVSKIKYDAITKWLDNFLESGDGEKVIVFAEHIDFVEKLAKRYGDIAVKIRGGVSIKDRQDAVNRFQTDPTCQIFIGNMAAASEGLTLTAASDVVFCELAWTPAMHEQCASRAWGRINDMHGCTAWYLLAPKTIDEDMYELLEKKKKIVDAVTDGIDVQDDGESILAGLLIKLAERGINV